MTSLPKRALKLFAHSFTLLRALVVRTINLFTKRDLVIIAFFTLLGIGGVFAAGRITLTPAEAQGAGYTAVTACDEAVTINKDVIFNQSTKRYEIATISITDVNQKYDVNGRNGCGNMIMELVYPLSSDLIYASWTIPSSTITDGVFTFGANNSTGITYRAYTSLNSVDVENSFEKAAVNIRPSTRAVTNGPVYDLLKDNGFTTAGQDASSSNITFVLSLSCGTLTVDTTQPGVSDALNALTAPTGYVKNNGTSTGVNGATSTATLGFRGTLANIDIVLPWISYSWKSDCTDPQPKFQGAIWNAQPTGVTAPVAWNFSENGHYYQYISNPTTWVSALNAITGSSSPTNSNTRAISDCSYKIFNLCGYFATVQTAAENAFITDKVGTAGAWLGGYDYNGALLQFRWSDPVAPEYNALFTQKVSGVYCCTGTNTAGSYTTSAPSYVDNVGTTFSYSNWNMERTGVNGGARNWNQPDYYGSYETYLQIIAGGSGKWNDLGSTNLGFIVEYGGSRAANESLSGGGSATPSIIWHW